MKPFLFWFRRAESSAILAERDRQLTPLTTMRVKPSRAASSRWPPRHGAAAGSRTYSCSAGAWRHSMPASADGHGEDGLEFGAPRQMELV